MERRRHDSSQKTSDFCPRFPEREEIFQNALEDVFLRNSQITVDTHRLPLSQR
jgi:hypothetical protein